MKLYFSVPFVDACHLMLMMMLLLFTALTTLIVKAADDEKIDANVCLFTVYNFHANFFSPSSYKNRLWSMTCKMENVSFLLWALLTQR